MDHLSRSDKSAIKWEGKGNGEGPQLDVGTYSTNK